MLIRDGSSAVDIALVNLGTPGTQSERDLRLDVAVTGPVFTGRNTEVWVERYQWDRFLEALRALVQTRRGAAQIIANSPSEFELSVFASDRAGHIAAEGWVGREYYTARHNVLRDRVCFSLEIDPTALPRLVEELEAIAVS